jgi:hypothetical protein
MLSKETKDALKSALLKLGIELPATQVVKLEDFALIDGTMLSVDKMEVGAMASFVGADGVAVPAEGEFELADGTKVICVAGLITEIVTKEAEVEIETQAKPLEDEMKAILSRLEALEKNYTTKQNLETQLSETKKGLSVALSAIDAMDKNAVALNLEANNKTVTKNYNDLTPLELFKLRKQNKFVG